MTREQISSKLDEASKILGEYFDAFQIMATWNEEDRTHRKFVGGGNWYARQGMAIEFVEQNKAQMNASEIASKLEPPPDDAESWKKP